jgi:sugar phosphate isomerase/epimerase
VPDLTRGYDLVASFFTLTGAGFGEPPRYSFVERCRAAADAGFSGIGLHIDDLPRTVASGLDVARMQAVVADTGLRVVEIEFLSGWALDSDPAALERTVRGIEAVADAFGGRHVSTGSSAATHRWTGPPPRRGSTTWRVGSTGAACRSRSRVSRGPCSPGRRPFRTCSG